MLGRVWSCGLAIFEIPPRGSRPGGGRAARASRPHALTGRWCGRNSATGPLPPVASGTSSCLLHRFGAADDLADPLVFLGCDGLSDFSLFEPLVNILAQLPGHYP